jgi:hypothetical protein
MLHADWPRPNKARTQVATPRRGILDKNRQGRGTELEFATPSPFKLRKGTFKIPSLNELTIVTLIRYNMFHEFLTNYPIMIQKRMDTKYTLWTN